MYSDSSFQSRAINVIRIIRQAFLRHYFFALPGPLVYGAPVTTASGRLVIVLSPYGAYLERERKEHAMKILGSPLTLF